MLEKEMVVKMPGEIFKKRMKIISQKKKKKK